MCVITTAVAGTAAAAMMANTAIAVSAASAMYGVYSSVQGARAHNKRARYMSKVAENNAQSARYEAQSAKVKASDEAARHRAGLRKFIGSQRSAAGASGAVVDTGSLLDLTLDSAEQGRLDELAILHQGDLNAFHLESQASGFAAQAEGYSAQQISPFASGAASGLKGLAQTGMTYYNVTRPQVK